MTYINPTGPSPRAKGKNENHKNKKTKKSFENISANNLLHIICKQLRSKDQLNKNMDKSFMTKNTYSAKNKSIQSIHKAFLNEILQ